tara:strand:+ start:4466 stop:5263 length:798 start_codon:yes stop_codon:yes gene_type:complete
LNKSSESYRKSRRNLTIACGIGLAWSASQFELKTVSIGLSTKVDFQNASIPIVFFLLITFLFIRCTLEFAMQDKVIRRWSLAAIDYRITINLVRVAMLALSTSLVVRTLDSILWVFLSAFALGLGFALLWFVLFMLIIPIRMYYRGKKGGTSMIAAIMEAEVVSLRASLILLVGLMVILALGTYQPLYYLEGSPEDIKPIPLSIFYGVAGAILLSIRCEHRMLKKLFLYEPSCIEKVTHLNDGTIKTTYIRNPEHPDYVKNFELT